MGSASSKFRKHLSNGDEVAALNLYNNNSDLRKGLDPNSSYGDSHNHDTPLHYAAKHGMKSLLRIFLHDHHGNPNKTNGKKETCLHCLCTEKPTHAQFYPVQKKRLDCLHIMLKWRGAELKDGEKERVDLTAQDENENTALHYAAASGLKYCVETLVQYGAPLFTENNDQETPCDSAERGGHAEIALYLESKMVFSNVGSEEEGTEDTVSFIETEDYSGLRAQDLQEAKDQLLVETADMLSVPLFTAEALLRNHEWSRETLLEAWMSDPLSCCDKCGVIPPPSVFCDKPQVQESLVSHSNTELTLSTLTCDICTQSYRMQKENIEISCEHKFCKDCWTEYLNLKIQEGDAHHITCPAYQCDILVPVEMIERVVSRDMARRYLQFDIKAFVDSNPNIKWCPYPGCARAVRLPELENSGRSQVIRRPEPTDTSRAVDCGNGHYFCWDCSGEAHEPSSCENWTKWYKKVAEIKPEELSGTEEDTKAAANCLWLVTNSKPCPNCKSPIQKNEGCNHMKCSKCKHDFCWVCLDQWKRHNSSTGGYFKCNRYEAVKVVQEETQKAQSQAEEKNQKMQELNKFVHYYTRFKNHENSYKLEEPLLSTTKNKMLKLAEAVTDLATANSETQFVEHAVQQLLKARRVLKCSYVYGYYLDGPGYKKIVFEFMQTELEECTEILSQMVNRLYLRTPRKKIIEQAHIVQRKRHEFILAISKGLVPPETPPGLRKHRRRKYSMDFEDDELRKAIMASMQEVDLSNPWIKDASGRHTNVMAVLDWPDSDDSDIEDAYTMQQGRCQHKNCRKPRAKNPRTGEIHGYCSRQCMYDDKLESPEQSEPVQEVIMDEQMDLLRALEMSRLQYLHDQGIISGERGSIAASLLESPHTTEATPEDSPVQRSQDKSPRSSSRQRSPKQKSPGSKQRGKGKGRKSVQAAMEELDLEIQRVLEISSISPAELEESLVSRTMLPPPVSSPGGNKQRSRHEEALSPCVPSVPNKSMDDTQHDDCLNCLPEVPREDLISLDFGLNADIHVPTSPIPQQQPMFHNRITRSKVRNQSDMPKETPERGCISDQSAASLHETNENSGSCFGIIKDISVSNLHIEDKDKVKTFPQINIRQLSMQEGIRASDADSFPTASRQESVTPPRRSRSKIFDDEGFMLSPLDSTMEYSTPDDFENRSMKISSISSGSRSNEENQRSHAKQKSKYSVLSAIAANTPGEDEMDRFVLCSPAESHADHVISYSSQDSPFEQEVVYDKSEDEACDGMTNLDGSASEELTDLDNYPESSYQMDHYSSEFIKSLLKDKAYYHDSEDEAEPMDQSEQPSQCFDQSKDSSVLTSHNLDVDALCIQPISDEVSAGHMDNLGEDVWVRRTELNDNQDHSYNIEPSNGRQTRHDSNIINQNQEEVTTIDNSYLAQNITTSHGQNNSEESETKDGESESREAPSAEPDGDLYKKDKSFFV